MPLSFQPPLAASAAAHQRGEATLSWGGPPLQGREGEGRRGDMESKKRDIRTF